MGATNPEERPEATVQYDYSKTWSAYILVQWLAQAVAIFTAQSLAHYL